MVAALKVGKDTVFWDRELTGFGVSVYPSGRKSYIVNYRAGDGGRKAPNKRVMLGRCDRISADRARRMAHQVLGNVAGGGDPANERAEARGMPALGQAFDEFMAANPNRAPTTDKGYRDFVERYLGDWLGRPLDAIARRDVEARFNRITTQGGWATANRTISLLRSAYSRPCVDYDGLRNPVDLWLAAGGKFHRKRRRKIPSPAEVLPRWRAGIQAVVSIAEIAGRLLVRLLHRHAPQRGAAAAMGSGGPGEADLPRRGDQDRRAAGVAGHAATGRPP